MSDAPTDETLARVVLRIEPDLLPGWFEAVKTVAADHVRRMGVQERPDGWIVVCELPADGREAFHAALQDAWTAFQAGNDEAD